MSGEFYLKKSNLRYDMNDNFVETGNQLAGSLTVQTVQGRKPLLDQRMVKFLAEKQDKKEKEQDEGETWKAFYKHWNLTDILEKDVRISLWDRKVKADSVEMQAVKDFASQVTCFMLKTEISYNEGNFLSQKAKILENYDNLIHACRVYIDEKKCGLRLIYRGEGYRRYELVKKTLARACSEKNQLEQRSDRFFQDFQQLKYNDERPLWINILTECRTSQLKLNKNTIRHVGGNCSDVIEIAQGKKKEYFKETTYNHTLQQKCDQYIDRALKSDLVKGMSEEEGIKGFLEIISKYFENEKFDVYNGVKDFQNQQQQEILGAGLKRVLGQIRYREVQGKQDELYSFLTKDDKSVDRLIADFFIYYKRSSTQEDIATFVAKIPEGANITNRNVATYRLAELLGISDLIPAVKKVRYRDENENDHQGILVEGAEGIKWYKAKDDKVPYDNAAYIQLNSLQILDTLTGQVDRNGSNCIMEKSEAGKNSKDSKISRIKGIDNDMCFGKISYEDYTYYGEHIEYANYSIMPIENGKGSVLKLIDKKVFDGVLALDDDLVKYAFADLLTQDEMKFFLNRIHGVKKLFRKIQNKGTVCIYDPKKMTEKEIYQARKSQQGISYYNRKFGKKYNRKIQNIIDNQPHPDFIDYM